MSHCTVLWGKFWMSDKAVEMKWNSLSRYQFIALFLEQNI